MLKTGFSSFKAYQHLKLCIYSFALALLLLKTSGRVLKRPPPFTGARFWEIMVVEI
jgi:hypothetical protein